MNNSIIKQNYLNDHETRIQVGIFKTSYGYETPQEIRKRVTSKVRFAGINLGKITHKIIIEELKKIQIEKVVKWTKLI